METQGMVERWLQGRATVEAETIRFANEAPDDLRRKSRRAYQWVVEHAIFAPYFDVEFGTAVRVGAGTHNVWLTDKDCYVSFALLPLLTLLTGQRLLLVGSPGRGKTTMATLMALLSGASLDDVRRAIQHGHPQMTHADLLGSPLPGDLVRAAKSADIHVIWRRWVSLRVKIIDEYNRIPTKTQSALLSLMAEGYAEMYEQTVHAGPSAWFLTANDDSGGGTFPVITALKDRIDAVVRTTPFNTEYLEDLARRVTDATTPEQVIPADIVFTAEQLDRAAEEIRSVLVPSDVLDALGFLLRQLDFCRRASDRLEYMNKDTLMLAGRRVGVVCTEDCPLDKLQNICAQTENGVSARAYQSLLRYAKALAWFRGQDTVSAEDIRLMLPWVLFDKLRPNPMSAFFQRPEHQVHLLDQVSWIRQLHDHATAGHAAFEPVHRETRELCAVVRRELPAMNAAALKRALAQLRRRMEDLLKNHELNAPVHHDLLTLKQLVTAAQNRLHSLDHAGNV
jgi:MoxR-like ATPase